MDPEILAPLASLIRTQRVAALGTLRQGAPLVSLVAYLAQDDFCAYTFRLSRLAWHTQDMLRDARVSLAIIEPDDGRDDPQTLARLSLRGEAQLLEAGAAASQSLTHAWRERFPRSAVTFELADFAFWRFVPSDARLVAGLGRTYNLSPADLAAAARA